MTGSIPAPWVLVDDDTARHTILLLQRLTGWLEASDNRSAASCAIALSNGETDDPITIANWSDGVFGHDRRRPVSGCSFTSGENTARAHQ